MLVRDEPTRSRCRRAHYFSVFYHSMLFSFLLVLVRFVTALVR